MENNLDTNNYLQKFFFTLKDAKHNSNVVFPELNNSHGVTSNAEAKWSRNWESFS